MMTNYRERRLQFYTEFPAIKNSILQHNQHHINRPDDYNIRKVIDQLCSQFYGYWECILYEFNRGYMTTIVFNNYLQDYKSVIDSGSNLDCYKRDPGWEIQQFIHSHLTSG